MPEGTKDLDSLGDVSAAIIDDYYADMKTKMTNQEHNQWADILTKKHIEYAAKDAYTAFEIWNRITTVQNGLTRAIKERTRKHPRDPGARGAGARGAQNHLPTPAGPS